MKRSTFILLVSGLLLLVLLALLSSLKKPAEDSAGNTTEEGRLPSVDAYAKHCAACHGRQGEGNIALGAPSISNVPRWYASIQLEKFRSGLRGGHPADITGQQMHNAVANLTDKQVASALDALAAFPRVEHRPTMTGDPSRGELLYRDNCMECHRFNGRGEVAFGSSHIAGLQDWYLLAQWNKFRAGIRGYHPQDEGGAKMRKAVHYLEDDSQVRDVIIYISTLAGKYPEK